MVVLLLYLLALKWAQEHLITLRMDIFIKSFQKIYCLFYSLDQINMFLGGCVRWHQGISPMSSSSDCLQIWPTHLWLIFIYAPSDQLIFVYAPSDLSEEIHLIWVYYVIFQSSRGLSDRCAGASQVSHRCQQKCTGVAQVTTKCLSSRWFYL